MGRAGCEQPGLPDDLLNFHYDPLACAVAAGWDGALVEETELVARQDDGWLAFPKEPGGRKTRAVTGVDGPSLEEEWQRHSQGRETEQRCSLGLAAARVRNPTRQPPARLPLLARVPASPIPSTSRAVCVEAWPGVAAVVLCTDLSFEVPAIARGYAEL